MAIGPANSEQIRPPTRQEKAAADTRSHLANLWTGQRSYFNLPPSHRSPKCEILDLCGLFLGNLDPNRVGGAIGNYTDTERLVRAKVVICFERTMEKSSYCDWMRLYFRGLAPQEAVKKIRVLPLEPFPTAYAARDLAASRFSGHQNGHPNDYSARICDMPLIGFTACRCLSAANAAFSSVVICLFQSSVNRLRPMSLILRARSLCAIRSRISFTFWPRLSGSCSKSSRVFLSISLCRFENKSIVFAKRLQSQNRRVDYFESRNPSV